MIAFAVSALASAVFWALVGLVVLVIRWRREDQRRKRTPIWWGR